MNARMQRNKNDKLLSWFFLPTNCWTWMIVIQTRSFNSCYISTIKLSEYAVSDRVCMAFQCLHCQGGARTPCMHSPGYAGIHGRVNDQSSDGSITGVTGMRVSPAVFPAHISLGMRVSPHIIYITRDACSPLVIHVCSHVE